MIVLAFDVGIKNLAYSIVEDKGDTYDIVEPFNINWNIINIIKDNIICECNGCENSVTKFCKISNRTYYFCGKHGRKMCKELLLKYPLNLKSIKTDKRCTCTKSCNKIAVAKHDERYMCQKHLDMFNKQIIKERSLQKYKLLVENFTVHDLKVKLLESLELYKELFLYVDYVCIENQPVYSNPTMKAIADTLYGWFLVRSIIDKHNTHSTIKKVCFFAASNKLKINGKDKEHNDQIKTAKNSYGKTKSLGVEECKRMISHNSNYVNHLDKFKKKDDMCDAYLHASYFIQKQQLKKNFDYTPKTKLFSNIRLFETMMFMIKQECLNDELLKR